MERKAQVLDQLRVVAALARNLAEVNEAMLAMGVEQLPEGIVDMLGMRTAYVMEELGNILSNQDAVQESDAWMDPIFERAHKMFPVRD